MKITNKLQIQASFFVLLLVTLTSGYLLAQDQSYSPAASLNGYVTVAIAELIAGIFVAYALYRHRSTDPKDRGTVLSVANCLATGLAFGFIGFFIAILLRSALVIAS